MDPLPTNIPQTKHLIITLAVLSALFASSTVYFAIQTVSLNQRLNSFKNKLPINPPLTSPTPTLSHTIEITQNECPVPGTIPFNSTDIKDFRKSIDTILSGSDLSLLTGIISPGQIDCSSDFIAGSNLCKNNRGVVPGYTVGYWESEGSVFDKPDFQNLLVNYSKNKMPFSFYRQSEYNAESCSLSLYYLASNKKDILILSIERQKSGFQIEPIINATTDTLAL